MKSIASALIVSTFALLSACSMTVTGKSTSIKQVKEVKLNNGTVTRVGYQPVESNWDCATLGKHSTNSAMNQFKGAFMAGSQYKALEDAAIGYANQTNLKPNYIYLFVPTEVEVESFSSSAFSKSEATYYQCKTVPEIRDSFMSVFK